MYRAKQAGRNRHHVFDPGVDRDSQARQEALARLAAALDGQCQVCICCIELRIDDVLQKMAVYGAERVAGA